MTKKFALNIVAISSLAVTALLLLSARYIHPSAFSRSRYRSVRVHDISRDELDGVWKIELPYPTPLGGYDDMKGWRDTELHMRNDGTCQIRNPTPFMLTEFHAHGPKEEVRRRLLFLGHTIEGIYEINPATTTAMRERGLTVTIKCDPILRDSIVLRHPGIFDSQGCRLLWYTDADTNSRSGILWKKVSQCTTVQHLTDESKTEDETPKLEEK